MRTAIDKDGTELKIGDTVEVLDDSGAAWFRNKIGQQFVITEIDAADSDHAIIYIGANGQYAYRFRKVNKVSNVGKKYNHHYNTNAVYTVLFENERGKLVEYINIHKDIEAFWDRGTDFATRYIEIIPERWVVIYKDSYQALKVASTIYPSEEEAKRAGLRDWPIPFIQVIKLENK